MSESPIVTAISRNPVQSLDHYRSWRLTGNETNPLNLCWISRTKESENSAHRLLPHSEPSIAIRRRFASDGTLNDVALVTCGPFTQAQYYAPARREELIAIQIKPELSANAFGLHGADLDNLAPIKAPAIVETACSHALSAAEKEPPATVLKLLYKGLMSLSAERTPTLTPHIRLANILRRSHGAASIQKVVNHLDACERTLRRRFKAETGVTPKIYARQLRLTRASALAEKEGRPNWARIAVQAGYHDQAHMIHEFRSMVHLTPGALHRERVGLSENYNS